LEFEDRGEEIVADEGESIMEDNVESRGEEAFVGMLELGEEISVDDLEEDVEERKKSGPETV
jgi:hypothetical protein